MTFVGKSVWFRLSPEGREALGQTLPDEPFQAQVLEQDTLGLWISTEPSNEDEAAGPPSLMLLKWQYFATAVIAFTPEPPPRETKAGFLS